MAQLTLTKQTGGYWSFVVDGDFDNEILNTRNDLLVVGEQCHFKTANGANIVKTQEITPTDVTIIGSQLFHPTDKHNLFAILIAEGYFDWITEGDGGGTGGVDRFDELTDTFKYIGKDGMAVVVDENQLRLIAVPFHNVSRTTELEDMPHSLVADKMLITDPTGTNYIFAPIPETPETFMNTVGYFIYEDLLTQETPVFFGNAVPTLIPNDGEGLDSDSTNAPLGVANIWRADDSQMDFTDLDIGDTVDLRITLDVSTMANNQKYQILFKTGIGSADENEITAFTLTAKSSGSNPNTFSVSFPIADENVRDFPAELYLLSDGSGEFKVFKFYFRIIRKNINLVQVGAEGLELKEDKVNKSQNLAGSENSTLKYPSVGGMTSWIQMTLFNWSAINYQVALNPSDVFAVGISTNGKVMSFVTWQTIYNSIPSGMGGGGNVGYVPKFTTANVIGDSLIFDTGTNIGIGKTNPAEKLDVNGNIKANAFKTLGGTATQFTKGDGSLDGNTYALDSNALHKTGGETFSGTKASTNAGTNQGCISLQNPIAGTPASSYALATYNTNTGSGIFTYNNAAGVGIFTYNNGSGDGISIENYGTGYGLRVLNVYDTIGVYLDNYSAGTALKIQNRIGGAGILIDSPSGTGYAKPFVFTKAGVEKAYIDDNAMFFAQSFSTVGSLSIANPASEHSTTDLINVTANGVQRFNFNAKGHYSAFISNGTADIGLISLAQPGGNVGILLAGITSGRADIRMNSTMGGIAFGTGTTNAFPPTQMLLETNGHVMINTSDNGVDYLQVGGSVSATAFTLTAAGTNRNLKMYNNSTVDNIAQQTLYPTSGTDVGTVLVLSPKGASLSQAVRSEIILHINDGVADTTNYGLATFRATNTQFIIGTTSGGSGILGNLTIAANYTVNTKQLVLYTSGTVAINPSFERTSAQLQVDSTTKGFLPPRMTHAQRQAISSPTGGLMVFCTDYPTSICIRGAGGWYAPDITQVTLTLGASADVRPSQTDANGILLYGKNVVFDNGANAVTFTVDSAITCTVTKLGTGTITFVQFSGRTMVAMNGTLQMTGAVGSTASVISVGMTDYVYITNY
jgi:hypothetical protein